MSISLNFSIISSAIFSDTPKVFRADIFPHSIFTKTFSFSKIPTTSAKPASLLRSLSAIFSFTPSLFPEAHPYLIKLYIFFNLSSFDKEDSSMISLIFSISSLHIIDS